MKKILFLALHLGYGGAERAIISQANILSEKYEVEIACAYKLLDQPAFHLDERVKVNYLSNTLKPNKDKLKEAIKHRAVSDILKEGIKSLKVLHHRTASIKRIIRESDADIIISTRYIYHKLLAKNKKHGVVTIGQEHNHHNDNEKYIQKIVSSVNDLDYFMPASRELTEFYSHQLDKTSCIYIPHSLDDIPEEVSLLNEPKIISVGRLSTEKGFVDLLDVFAEISNKYSQWELHIIGDGEERSKIEASISNHNLKNRVILHGYKNKTYINDLLSKSSIYVMTSFTESFGIVLIEAQSFGIPCVAYDSAQGALEIIENEKNGYLISGRNKDDMCKKIGMLIEDIELRKKLGESGRLNAMQYSVLEVKKKWFNFLDTL